MKYTHKRDTAAPAWTGAKRLFRARSGDTVIFQLFFGIGEPVLNGFLRVRPGVYRQQRKDLNDKWKTALFHGQKVVMH